MKSLIVILMMFVMLPCSAQLFEEAPAKNHRFTHVDLQKLRKVVLNQLLKDDLIQNKKSEVFLFLKEDGIKLNRLKLPAVLESRYTALLDDYNLGKGPNRMILISRDCTAVGDFWEESFSGKSNGRLSLPEARKAMEALE